MAGSFNMGQLYGSAQTQAATGNTGFNGRVNVSGGAAVNASAGGAPAASGSIAPAITWLGLVMALVALRVIYEMGGRAD